MDKIKQLLQTYIVGVFVSIIIAVVIAIGLIMLAQSEEVRQDYDGLLDRIDREAVEQAYKNQVMHLFEVWMKDPTGQPDRAVAGVQRARQSFIDAMSTINRRR